MNCNCGEAKLLEVKKEGPNQGRKFYACAQPKGSQCDFFCWDGETARQVQARVPANPERTELMGKVLAQLSVKLDTTLSKLDTALNEIDKLKELLEKGSAYAKN